MRANGRFPVLLIATVLLAGCGAGPYLGDEAPTMQTQASLGGVAFPVTSAIIDCRLGHLQPGQSPWVGTGWGTESGHTMKMTFAAGGRVQGVETVLVTELLDGAYTQKQWLARDKSGNVHYLKRQKAGGAAQLWGLAAGGPAALYTPRSTDVKAGYTWYHTAGGKKMTEFTFLTLSAASRGKDRLIQRRQIDDGNGDQVFAVGWRHVDKLRVVFFEPYLGPWHVQTRQDGGFVRQDSSLCPTARIDVLEGNAVLPLTVLHLDALESFGVHSAITRYLWQVTQPANGQGRFTPGTTSAEVTFPVDASGTYTFLLSVWDAGDRQALTRAKAVVEVRPSAGTGIQVELVWNTPLDPNQADSGPSAGSDMDLHLVHPSGFGARADLDGDGLGDPYFSQPYDCFWFNPGPVWQAGAPARSGPNPSQDRDDIDGAGPETMRISAPAAGTTYEVGVNYWADHGYGPSSATVRFWIGGVLRAQDTIPRLVARDMWRVAKIEWPSATVTLIRREGVRWVTPNYDSGFTSPGRSPLVKPRVAPSASR